jgi:nitroimidazol reductase NimA-like FMN-containing flavoprotein (pyridoxamine 5'-phosphate oxidase superfamily)
MRQRLTAGEKRYLQRARVCRVGSVDRRGVVQTAPLCHAFDPRTRTAYVSTGGATAANLRERPRAALECDDYFEDWGRLKGLVAHVRARFVRKRAERDRATMLLRRKFRQYGDTEFDTIIALRVERVASWGV